MVKISIIIPVYNDSVYVTQCIQSVLNQTLKEIEIVCIDDGSTDDSARLIERMMQGEERIVLLQQRNQGPGIARNEGIRKAKGKYVAFLDADDYYLETEALEKMYCACEENHVAVCACLRWCINGRIVKTEKLESLEENQTERQIFSYMDFQMDYNYINYLFLRDFLVERELWFPPYYRFEDPLFLVHVLYSAKQFTVVNACLYYYRFPVVETRFELYSSIQLLQGLIDNLLFARKHKLTLLYKTTLWRIEYEYADVILKNMVPNDSNILKLLIEINHIVNSENEKKEYIIRPLRKLMLNQCEKNLLRKIRGQKGIALYGAGELGSTIHSQFFQQS